MYVNIDDCWAIKEGSKIPPSLVIKEIIKERDKFEFTFP